MREGNRCFNKVISSRLLIRIRMESCRKGRLSGCWRLSSAKPITTTLSKRFAKQITNKHLSRNTTPNLFPPQLRKTLQPNSPTRSEHPTSTTISAAPTTSSPTQKQIISAKPGAASSRQNSGAVKKRNLHARKCDRYLRFRLTEQTKTFSSKPN